MIKGYHCRVECDSLNPVTQDRLTTFVIRYPRVCLAEVLTHRRNSETWGDDVVFCERSAPRDQSKSSASSRAIPFERMVQQVKDDPFMPAWTLQQKGMQGAVLSDQEVIKQANIKWENHLLSAIYTARELHSLGIHKQECNRLLEPWAWVTQVVTSSRWDNFFGLRCHEKAFPPFRHIARMMYLHRRKSDPTPLRVGQWHLPFVAKEERSAFNWIPELDFFAIPDGEARMPYLIQASAARCAWVSYENHDRDASVEAHLRTYKSLFAEVPVHGGPVEHQGTPMHPAWQAAFPRLRSNLVGFLQARKLIKHEEITNYSPPEEEIRSWGITI